MVSFESSDLKKLGVRVTGFGVIIMLIGLLLLFDKGFLIMGNILVFSGVILIVGPTHALQFATKQHNFKGTLFLLVGFLIIVIGFPIVGMMLETYGYVVLLSVFSQRIAIYAKNVPVLGPLLREYSYMPSFFGRQGIKRVPV